MSDSSHNNIRVAINAYFSRHPNTGSGQYLAGLLSALPDVASDCQLELLAPDVWGRAKQPSSAASGLPLGNIAKLAFEQLGLPRAVRNRADVLHYPYWAAPLHAGQATVVTVHDLIPLLLAAYRGTRLVRAYTRLVSIATRRTTMLIADSASTKSDIVARLRVSPERVRVVYLAPDARFRAVIDPALVAAVRQKYGLAQPFVFYVGGLDRRKNVDRLIAAFAKARPALDAHFLVIAGQLRPADDLFPDLSAVARDNGVGDVVRFLGLVSDADLFALYHAAAAFAYPSLYEGFGLPPLEALSCGTPVLCSNASSLPEVAGDAALLLDPHDEAAWAAALVRVLTDDALRRELRARGPLQGAKFDWRRAASETVAVYLEACERFRGNGGRKCA